jgi:hypothetical protein
MKAMPTGERVNQNRLRFAASGERFGKIQVHPEGFEPPTLGSEDQCSIQLSYGCKLFVCSNLRLSGQTSTKMLYTF